MRLHVCAVSYLAFSAREEGVIFFLSAISPFCVTLLSTIICAFFVSYFIERCSFAILVSRKKIKLIHANMSIYTCCVLLYHSPVLQNTKMIPRQNFSKDKTCENLSWFISSVSAYNNVYPEFPCRGWRRHPLKIKVR